jgi:glycine/D-amino acid oxidase-like deaminating enzyme
VIGLTTAVLLQRLGYDVHIYAAAAWPHTTSSVSAATFYPSHVIAPERVTPPFVATLEAALRRSYHAYQRMTGSRYAVKWLDSFGLQHGPQPTGEPDVETRTHIRVTGDNSRVMGPGEHPFAADRVVQGRDLVIEPMTYLRSMLDDARAGGATLHIRRFDSASGPMRIVAFITQRAVIAPILAHLTSETARASPAARRREARAPPVAPPTTVPSHRATRPRRARAAEPA